MKMRNPILVIFAIVLAVSISLGLSVSDNRNFELSKNLSIYQSILRELNIAFVDDINPKELIDKSIESMLNTLDPYTTYISEDELEDFRTMATGEYAGIGAIIGKQDKYVIIVEPYKNFPADKFGLKAGDKIIEVNDENVIDKEISDVSKMLKGKPETYVKIKIKRPYQDTENTFKTIEVIRKKIQIQCVPYYGIVNEDVGYIVLTNFTEKAETAVKNAMIELKSQGAKYLVLDVRGNPGGLLSQAIKVTNLFVEKGTTIVSTKGKHNKWQKKYIAKNYAVDKNIPLVVLVDESSASASEILAGTIQDIDRGVVVGTRTFGKGLVQQTRPLAFDAQLKLTTAYYYLPSGRSIQKLDYRYKDENGESGKNDSSTLVTEYKTNNGRKVFDGGGINPDYVIDNFTLSRLTTYLARKYIVFDFASQYVAAHPSISPASEFIISDDDFQDFKIFVENKNTDYNSEASEALTTLKRIAKKENIFDEIEDEVNALEQKLSTDINEKLDTYKKELKNIISYEIAKRYYYQNGAIQNMLSSDETLQKSVEILHDKEQYTSTLSSSFIHN